MTDSNFGTPAILYIKYCEECGKEFETGVEGVRLCRDCYLKNDEDVME